MRTERAKELARRVLASEPPRDKVVEVYAAKDEDVLPVCVADDVIAYRKESLVQALRAAEDVHDEQARELIDVPTRSRTGGYPPD